MEKRLHSSSLWCAAARGARGPKSLLAAADPAAESGGAAPGLRWAAAAGDVPVSGLTLSAKAAAEGAAPLELLRLSPGGGETGLAIAVDCGWWPYFPVWPRAFTLAADGWMPPQPAAEPERSSELQPGC
ncbi:hypothetical protein NDU88_001559 [Pleurodeles waltl]|uniref:Uncharacterized protein n=1 Tax=Pleurodeles waltl TaxID=8319 RepID=A0AAV7UT50_PLEWA|nr:hypothetical protein NDU88_001559 [Pleurodeles waltl]